MPSTTNDTNSETSGADSCADQFSWLTAIIRKDGPDHAVSAGMTTGSPDQGFQICRTIMHIKDSSLHIFDLLSSSRIFIPHLTDLPSLVLFVRLQTFFST